MGPIQGAEDAGEETSIIQMSTHKIRTMISASKKIHGAMRAWILDLELYKVPGRKDISADI